MTKSLSLSVLGKPSILLSGEPVTNLGTSKVQALFYYLAVTGEEHERSELAALLWGADSDEKAKNSLRVALASLRKILADYLDVTRQTIAFKAESSFWLDVNAFAEYIDAYDKDPNPSASEALSQAVSLYRGDFLEDFFIDSSPAFEDWLLTEREHHRQLAIRLLRTVAADLQQQRRYRDARDALVRLLELEPWEEETHFALMETLSRLGDFNSALAQYHTCTSILQAELAVEPMPETTALYVRIQAARKVDRHNLPADVMPFVGRENELSQLHKLLTAPACRLVTIYGLGGMGKTRLAVAAARQMCLEEALLFLNGVVYVPLASIHTAERLVSALVEKFDIKWSGNDPLLTILIDHLENWECMIVLDGFESLLSPETRRQSVEVIQEILYLCPDVKFLVSSRELLEIAEEAKLELRGLAFPPDSEESGIEEYSAVKLFLQSAEQVRPGYQITNDDRPYIIELCQLLGGMPLGIKLSAAWLRAMSCQRIVGEISKNLDILSTRMRDVEPRQRSMRAVLDYSWELLDEQEKAILTKLTVFQGGFSRNAARQIIGTDEVQLANLVGHSLLQSERFRPLESTAQTQDGSIIERYSMHQMVYQYAAGKKGDFAAARHQIESAHCQYFVSFLQEQTALFNGLDETVAIDAISRETRNIQAAWSYALQEFNTEAIKAILEGHSRYYELVGPFHEAEAKIRSAIEILRSAMETGKISATEAEPIMARLLLDQARFLGKMGRNEQALDILDAAAAFIRSSGVESLRATELSLRALALFYLGHLDGGYEVAQQSRSLANKLHLLDVELSCLTMLGIIHLQRNQYIEARAVYEEALTIARQLQVRRVESNLLNNLGVIAVQHSDYATARERYEQALNLSVEIGDRHGEGQRLNNLGRALSEQRDYGRAEAHFKHASRLASDIGDRVIESNVLLSRGRNAMYVGAWDMATDLYEMSLAIKREISDLHGVGEVLTYISLLNHFQGDNRRALELGYQGLREVRQTDSSFVVLFSLTNIGHALVELNRHDEARDSYTEALAGREALGHKNLSMEPLAGLLDIGLRQRDKEAVITYTDAILEHLSSGNVDGTDQPFKIFWTAVQALKWLDSVEAVQLLQRAKDELVQCAERIQEEEMRRSFLENVPIHALLLAEQHP